MPRTLIAIHAHPDDEASKTAATVARYAREGVRCILVTATGGEEGEYLNPSFAGRDPADLPDLPELRARELARSAGIIGYQEVISLGFRDSGMAGTAANADSGSFAALPLEDAAKPLVELIRRERPQVVISYGENQAFYPHPDHIRVFEAARTALQLACDPLAWPELGDAWRVPKWYWSLWTRERFEAVAKELANRGIEPPFRMQQRDGDDHLVTTRIDVSGTLAVARDALLAHESQIDPSTPFWFAISPEEMAAIYPFEEYHLVGSAEEEEENDLFAGVELS